MAVDPVSRAARYPRQLAVASPTTKRQTLFPPCSAHSALREQHRSLLRKLGLHLLSDLLLQMEGQFAHSLDMCIPGGFLAKHQLLSLFIVDGAALMLITASLLRGAARGVMLRVEAIHHHLHRAVQALCSLLCSAVVAVTMVDLHHHICKAKCE